MRLLRPSFPAHLVAGGLGVVASLWLLGSVAPLAAQQVDPVDNLQQELKSRVGFDEPPAALKFRLEKLEAAAAKLRTTSDLRRALALTEWKDLQGGKLGEVDLQVRTEIGKRLQDIVARVVATGDSTSRIAVGDLLAEMAVSIRALNPNDRFGFARSMAPDLITLMGMDDPQVRQTAARALGKINPEPKPAVKALSELLHSKNDGDRRAASDALAEMVSTVFERQKKSQAEAAKAIPPEDVIECAEAVMLTVPLTLKDKIAAVRRNGGEVFLNSVTAFYELLPAVGPGGLFDPEDMPPPGREWTPAEKLTVQKAREALDAKEKLFEPLMAELKGIGQPVAKSLSDNDVEVRVALRKSLELTASSRLRFLQLRDFIPIPLGQAAPPPADDPLFDAVRPSLLALSEPTKEPSTKVRLWTVHFLETLESDAAPAIPTLLAALKDRDQFVRWAAARTLGKVGPVQANVTAPAIARLLSPQEDPDVREAAATALRIFGPAAKEALPALIAMLNVGEAEAQEAVIKAINSVGAGEATEAIPALQKSLESRSANVRRLAAEALGRLGPAAASAIPALQARHEDEDPSVKIAVSDAILNISRPRQ